MKREVIVSFKAMMFRDTLAEEIKGEVDHLLVKLGDDFESFNLVPEEDKPGFFLLGIVDGEGTVLRLLIYIAKVEGNEKEAVSLLSLSFKP